MTFSRTARFACFALIAVATPNVLAQAATAPAKEAGTTHADMMLLTVDKSTLQADLRTWPEELKPSTLIHSFRIAIGKAEGDKEREGDNRTPEGIYFTQDVIPGPIPAKYGPRAIPLNFPNPMDRLSGKTGHGIWLHGAGNDERIQASKVTEGCVAFYNADIESLTSWLRPHQGVVVIARDVHQVDRPEDMQAIDTRTKAWETAWATRDIDSYMSFYAPNVEVDGRDFAAYKTYKSHVFKMYKTMDLRFSQLRIVSHPKYAVSMMDQDFRGDKRYNSSGRKILYWYKAPGKDWQIVREVFEDRRVELVKYTDDELAVMAQPHNVSATAGKPVQASSL